MRIHHGSQKVVGTVRRGNDNKQRRFPVAEVNDVAPIAEKWAAFGWNVIEVEDGNDVEQVEAAVEHAKLGRDSGKPTMIILNTVKGCGVQWIVDLGAGNHNSNINEEQAAAAIREIRGED